MNVQRANIKGIVGIFPTPATKDAADWRAGNTINFAETEKMVENVVKAGIEIVMTAGTFGECATLTHEELLSFNACVAKTVAGRVPFFAGVTTLNTRDTIARGREAIKAGASGLFIGRPMWLPLDEDGVVRFYREITEALPGVPLVIYDNPGAFKGKITVDTFKRLTELREIVAAKHAGGPQLEADVLACGDAIAVLPIESEWVPIAKRYPKLVTACWSGNIACGPSPSVALSRAVAAQNWDVAAEITKKMHWAAEPQYGKDFARFMSFSIPIGRGRFRAAGFIDPGPSRPPYTEGPADLVAGGEETGRRLAQLEREYRRAP